MNFDTGLRTFAERFRKFLADLTRPIDVGFKTDRLCGTPDCFEHGRENLVAILKCDDAIIWEELGAKELAYRTGKLRIIDPKLVIDQIFDLLFSRTKIQKQYAEEGADYCGNDYCQNHSTS